MKSITFEHGQSPAMAGTGAASEAGRLTGRSIPANGSDFPSPFLRPSSGFGAASQDHEGLGAELPAHLDPLTIRAKTLTIPRWKRALDLTFIVLTLPLWLPLMMVITLFIKLTSPGPVFYRQSRIGFRGKHFMLYKFRSMQVNAATTMHESHLEHLMRQNIPMTKLDAGDRRIIWGGRTLRAVGLDELPQLINVIFGEMSLVGPRPCTVPEFERYLPWQQARVNVPPGLTGYWQVNGKNRTTFKEMIEMDLLYGRKMSLILDLAIICWTLPALWRQTADLAWARFLRGSPQRRTPIQVSPLS
jgi:lipopolysaccharide/colanic/teichoic acid biosynthesis glycosyltransferase